MIARKLFLVTKTLGIDFNDTGPVLLGIGSRSNFVVLPTSNVNED